MKTVSFVYDISSSSDERNFIECVEQKIGAAGLHVRESDYPPLSLFPDQSRISFPDGIDLHFARHKALFEEMNNDGARVLLTGHGGDEMLHSNSSPASELMDLIAQRQPLRLHRTLRNWCKSSRSSYMALLWEDGIVPSLPLRLQLLFDRRDYLKLPAWINAGFAKSLGLRKRKFSTADVFGFKLPSSRNQALGYLSVVKLVSKAAYRARGSIEVSHPYMHRPLVEFIHAIPIQQQLRPGETRSLMRRALKGLLPEKVLNRKTKRGPDEAMLRAISREWPQLERMFTKPHAEALGYVDSQTLLAGFERGRHGQGNTSLAIMISLELWLGALEGWGVKAKSTAARQELSPVACSALVARPAGS